MPSDWLPLLVVTALALLLPAPRSAAWVTRHHEEAPWETTSDPADLDAEVAAGARILRYADGTYIHAIHRQYPQACGPASLVMMLRHMGLDDPGHGLELPADVDQLPGSPGPAVDVGYVGSMEHIMWLGFHRQRLRADRGAWNADRPDFMSPDGLLNTEPGPERVAALGPQGEMAYLGFAGSGRIPKWLWHAPGVGTGGDDNGRDGLPGIINYIIAGTWGRGCPDARPLTAFSRNGDEVRAFRRIIKGFIDHEIPVLLGIESGGHFNVTIGYRGDVENPNEPFLIYTADPLDGWGRPEGRLPGRWRRMNAVAENMFNGRKLLYQYVCWNQHLNGGCEDRGWAREVDELNGNEWLCGRPVPAEDPLNDPLALPDAATKE